jgi:hypothetical protein
MERTAVGALLILSLGCATESATTSADAAVEPDGPVAQSYDAAAAQNDTALAASDAGPDGLPPADAGLVDGPAAPAPDAQGGVWTPRPGTSWQWQISGTLDTTVDVQMYDIDLFDASDATIAALHAAGRTVICYLSAGSHEDWRPDAATFPAAAIGKPLDGWPGERWLDTRSEGVRAIMKERLDRAAAKRCDGVEPDNVDGYTYRDNGFPLTAATQLDYNRFLAREAHARGLSVGLKNDLDQVEALLPDFDWALNESCLQYDECKALSPFITAGKAVFHVEYGAESLAQTVCPKTKPLHFSTLIKKQALDAWRVACP